MTATEPQRAYSLSSAPHEAYLAITVKEEGYSTGVTEYPPLLSPLLVFRTPRGTRMQVTGFSGPLRAAGRHRRSHRARQQGTEARPRFLEGALNALSAIGVPGASIHYERYG